MTNCRKACNCITGAKVCKLSNRMFTHLEYQQISIIRMWNSPCLWRTFRFSSWGLIHSRRLWSCLRTHGFSPQPSSTFRSKQLPNITFDEQVHTYRRRNGWSTPSWRAFKQHSYGQDTSHFEEVRLRVILNTKLQHDAPLPFSWQNTEYIKWYYGNWPCTFAHLVNPLHPHDIHYPDFHRYLRKTGFQNSCRHWMNSYRPLWTQLIL